VRLVVLERPVFDSPTLQKRSRDGSSNALANPHAFSEPSSSLLPSAPPPALFAPSQSSAQGEGPDPNDNEAQIPGLTQWLEQLKIDPATPRFHNESHSYRAVMEVVGIKHTFSGQPSGNVPWSDMTLNGGALTQREEFWRTQPVLSTRTRGGFDHVSHLLE
jgi:hypothetical protein